MTRYNFVLKATDVARDNRGIQTYSPYGAVMHAGWEYIGNLARGGADEYRRLAFGSAPFPDCDRNRFAVFTMLRAAKAFMAERSRSFEETCAAQLAEAHAAGYNRDAMAEAVRASIARDLKSIGETFAKRHVAFNGVGKHARRCTIGTIHSVRLRRRALAWLLAQPGFEDMSL